MKNFAVFILCLLASSGLVYADNKSAATASSAQGSGASGVSGQENWDPYAEMEKIRKDFNRVLQKGLTHAGRGLDWAQSQSGEFDPRLDQIEEKSRYVIKVDLPGVQKDKLDVKVTDKNIIVAGERVSEIAKTDKDTGVYRQERSFGRFERSLPIPDNVKADQISAKYDLGVLTIELPKIKPSEPAADNARKIQIQ